MKNTIVYNSPPLRQAPYPYGVLAAGHSRFTPRDPAITARFHEHTLLLTTGGQGEISANSQTMRPQPLTISWVDTSGRYRHGCAPNVETWTYIWFSFDGYGVNQLYAQLARRHQLHAQVGLEAVEIFKGVAHTVSLSHPGRQSQLSSLVGQALALFENSPHQLGIHDSLQRLTNVMCDNLAHPWDTKTMASQVGLSVSRFHALFRDEFGVPPATWLREQRINAAKRLLTETTLAVTQIGEQCGYPDPHHFSREFAKNALLSPSKFRTQMQSRVARG